MISHNNSLGNYVSTLSVFFVALVQSPAVAEYFKGFFSGLSHSATRHESGRQEMAQSPLNGTTCSVLQSLYPVCSSASTESHYFFSVCMLVIDPDLNIFNSCVTDLIDSY